MERLEQAKELVKVEGNMFRLPEQKIMDKKTWLPQIRFWPTKRKHC